MAVNHLDAYMVKAMCSNVKMEFDLAKANFLEIQDAMDTFHGYLKRMEQLEKQNPNNALDNELAHLKDAVNRAKENMNTLRGRLAKNTHRAEEGYRLLTERLKKIEQKVTEVQSLKRKFEDSHAQYKRLRTNDNSSLVCRNRIADRPNKLHQLNNSIQEAESTISTATNEKLVLQEACNKMQVFLEDTKEVMNHFKEPTCARKKAALHLCLWFTGNILSTAGLHHTREHSIDENSVAVEFLNLPELPSNTPRLVVTLTFVHKPRGIYSYSIINAKPNVESLYVNDLVDEVIEHNDVVEFLLRVQKRWRNHIPLLAEIIQLREKFAIDWLAENNRLRLMLGNAGRIICTLQIPVNYPHKGEVTLEKVDGIAVVKSVASYKPQADTSISGWLHYLTEHFK